MFVFATVVSGTTAVLSARFAYASYLRMSAHVARLLHSCGDRDYEGRELTGRLG